MGSDEVILLDTHIWIEALSNSGQISEVVRNAIEDPDEVVAVSAVSHWELYMLIERGRIAGDSYEGIKAASDRLGVISKPITPEIAVLSRQIALNHQDPADRFIAATAIAHRATLATRDAKLLGHSWLPTI